MPKFILALMAGFLMVGQSCVTESTASRGDEAAPELKASLLPHRAMPDAAGCKNQPAHVDLCDWVTGYDSVVIATVVELSPHATESVMGAGDSVVIEDGTQCAGPVDLALRLRVRVLLPVWGGLSQGEEIDVYEGSRYTSSWSVFPVHGATPTWSDGSAWTKYFAPNSTLLLPLTKASGSEKWGSPRFKLKPAPNGSEAVRGS